MSAEPAGGAARSSISRARISIERILAFSLWFGLLAHGLFFTSEIVAMGFILAIYGIFRGRILWRKIPFALSATDFLLLGMIILSLAGLVYPVKVEEAWLEGIRYLIYWFVYRFSLEISGNARTRQKFIRITVWAAFALILSAWIPWVDKIWPAPGFPEAGRLSSWLGYPNATAAYLGAVFFLPGLNWWVKGILFLSLLSTGSRTALGLLLLLKSVEFIYFLIHIVRNGSKKRPWISKRFLLRVLQYVGIKKIGILIIVMILSLSAMGLFSRFHLAWEHIWSWGAADKSWGERILYFQDGWKLAWEAKFLPRAGGWLAFPLIQQIPYWSLEPHSSLIHILLNQGLAGLTGIGFWSFMWFKRARKNLRRTGPREWSEGLSQITQAMIFLLLHSLVDADLSFAALGIFFWLWAGQVEGLLHLESHSNQTGWLGSGLKTWLYAKVKTGLGPVLALFLLIAVGKALLFEGLPFNKHLVAQETFSNNGGLTQKNYLMGSNWLKKTLAADQSNIDLRKQLAKMELNQGHWEQGIKEVENVLAWAKFDLGAYEWAQGAVWEAAEVQRKQGNNSINIYYLWIEQVPALIQERSESVPVRLRYLWVGYSAFHTTPHIDLLARQARELTLHSL